MESYLLNRKQYVEIDDSDSNMLLFFFLRIYTTSLLECTPDPATLSQMGWVSTVINRKCMLLAWKLLNLQDRYIFKKVALYRFVHFRRPS